MQLIPITTDQQGQIVIPPMYYVNEMRQNRYPDVNGVFSDDAGFYHRQVFRGKVTVFTDTRMGIRVDRWQEQQSLQENLFQKVRAFRRTMRRKHGKNYVELLHWKDNTGFEIMYGINGPLPKDAINGDWMMNMENFRFIHLFK